MPFEFESYKVAHDLPEVSLVTFINHDHPATKKSLRLTSVAVLIPSGEFFIGIAGCSEGDTFNKKVGFNIAYGRALQELTWFRRSRIRRSRLYGPIKRVDMTHDYKDIGRWIQNAAKDAKIDFIKRVLARRQELDFKKALKIGMFAQPSLVN